ncbi:fatty acid--CoA ligase family protein [Pseudomonas serboccidentalis]|uniref:Fatty acid--CoA ligase family protein n=1 Tax=Pseudomonas serboccidentalis TaxID=2964670 RepID=A0ABY7Z5X9_9PSED|nr:fatty acid--CoA ligase family protein [Pseudomonas serboccidentalis]WDR34995.1 fatty acid--CoA ligase family protein [Pseudomonas serboccidentalis]
MAHLKSAGNPLAIVSDEGRFTYDQLHAQITAYGAELAAKSVRDSCVLLVDNYSFNSVCMLFALWLHNNVVALSVPKGEEQLAQLSGAAGARFSVIGGMPEFAVIQHANSFVPTTVDGLLSQHQAGFIVFSSGSTGPAKGVVHSIAPFFERYLGAERCGAILAFLLFDHIGGLVTVLQALATHGTLILPQERSPQEVGRCIEAFNVQTLHVSPTLLNLATITGVFQKWNTTSLQRIYFGSEPSSPEAIQRIANLMPHVQLQQLYGMSEIGVLPCRSKDGDSAWMKVDDPKYSLRVVDGILQVRGATNMLGYLGNDGDLSSDGYLITHDLAEEHEGYFRVTGRAVDLINVGGKKVFPSHVESVLMGLENVSDVVVYAQPNPLLGQIVAARFTLFEPETLEAFKVRLYQHVRGVLAQEQLPRVISIAETPLYTSRFKKMRHPGVLAQS